MNNLNIKIVFICLIIVSSVVYFVYTWSEKQEKKCIENGGHILQKARDNFCITTDGRILY